MENDLTIIPVLNKIDLPAAQPEKFAEELANLIGCEPEDVLQGLREDRRRRGRSCWTEVVREVPRPGRRRGRPRPRDDLRLGLRLLPRCRHLRQGRRRQLSKRERIRMMSTGATHELLEIGTNSPEMTPADGLGVGEVGYLITGVKDVRQSKVGDTITRFTKGAERGAAAATRTRSRWSSRACIRWTARTTPSCATPWTSSSSTTPRWSTSRRPPRPSASASASASSACCTWRSSGSAWSASSASI